MFVISRQVLALCGFWEEVWGVRLDDPACVRVPPFAHHVRVPLFLLCGSSTSRGGQPT